MGRVVGGQGGGKGLVGRVVGEERVGEEIVVQGKT